MLKSSLTMLSPGTPLLRDFEIEMDGRSTKPIEVTVKATGHKDAVKNLWVQRGKSSDLKFELTRMGPPTIHALLIIPIASSLPPMMRGIPEKTSNSVNGLLQMIASELGSELKSTFLKGDTSEVNPAQISSQWFKALRPNRNDIVFVYYFGEGMADQNGELYLTNAELGPYGGHRSCGGHRYPVPPKRNC